MRRRKQAKPPPHWSTSTSKPLPSFQGLSPVVSREHTLYPPKAGPSSSLRSRKLSSPGKSKEAGGQEVGEGGGGGGGGGGNGIGQDPEDLSVPFGCVWGWGDSHSLPPDLALSLLLREAWTFMAVCGWSSQGALQQLLPRPARLLGRGKAWCSLRETPPPPEPSSFLGWNSPRQLSKLISPGADLPSRTGV